MVEGTICVFELPDMNSNAVSSVTIPLTVGRASEDESDKVQNEFVVVRGSLEDVFEPTEKKFSSEMSDNGRVLAFPLGGGVT